jgi:hypothetical protein
LGTSFKTTAGQKVGLLGVLSSEVLFEVLFSKHKAAYSRADEKARSLNGRRDDGF